jgi:superfamily II DNA helicase RecQ
MKDQVEQLRQLGVETALLNSSLSPDEYNRNYESVMSKKAKAALHCTGVFTESRSFRSA